MKKLRSILAFALVLLLAASLMPRTAFADEEKVEENIGSSVTETISNPSESNEPVNTEDDANDSELGAESPVTGEEEAGDASPEEAEVYDDEIDAESLVTSEQESDDDSPEETNIYGDEIAAENLAADIEKADNTASEETESGMPLMPEAFSGSAPEAPVSPVEPDLSDLSDEEANEKIRLYNEEVDLFNEAVERYNAEFDAYEASAEKYNASVENYNERAASYNTAAEEHNLTEQQKLDAYDAAMEDYNKKASTYINYQAKIDAVSDRNLAKAEGQTESLGDILRADKDSILTLGTVLEEDYTVSIGRRTNTLGHAGDLVISWDDLTAGNDHSTILIQEGEPSEETYKVANLHIFQDFADFNEMNDYQSELGWDCMNINVDDENGMIIIPKALIDRIAMIEIEVAEVGKNDTVTVVGQNSIFESTYVTTVGRFFEGYTDGPYWYSAGSVFQSTAVDSESDWTGTGHTFSYSAGTTDLAGIKNPLNINNYVFQRYSNPYALPEKPEEVSTAIMDKVESLSFVEVLGSRLGHLMRLPEREIQKEENPAPIVPIVPEIPAIPAASVVDKSPDDGIPLAVPEMIAEESVEIPAPIVAENPLAASELSAKESVEIPAITVVESPDDEIPLAASDMIAEESAEIPAATVVEIPLATPELSVKESAEIPVSVMIEIPDDEIPLAAPDMIAEKSVETQIPVVVEIPDDEIPLAASDMISIESVELPASGASWALVNLIVCLLTILLAVVKVIGWHGKEDDNEGKKNRISLSLIIPAIVSVVLFILTENMNNPMAMVDRWTPVMLIFLVANCLLILLSSFRNNRDSKTELSWKIG